MVTVRVRGVRDEIGADDGTRVLVDRVWPRGVRKQDVGHDEWCRDVAPSTELRKWYGHDPDRFDEFRRRYVAELDGSTELERLRELARDGTLTLLTATREPELSQAAVLRDLLDG